MSFKATLYNCTDDPRKLNKTLQSGTTILSITPTESCDILNPTFILNYDSSYTSKNYIVVEAPFSRSYFITDMKIDIGKKIIISCNVDVLDSYKTGIEKIETTIIRNQNPGKLKAPYMPDPQYNIISGYNYKYKFFDGNPFKPSQGTYVLSWVGDQFYAHYIQITVQPADWDVAWGKYFYQLSDGTMISCLTNYPYQAPDFNTLSQYFGVYEYVTT